MSAKSVIPGFFIVGAAKSGTTALYNYFEQHPEVYMSPIKEPNHFASDINIALLRPSALIRLKALHIDNFLRGNMKNKIHRAYITDRSQYLSLFRFVTNEKQTGEASPAYLYSKTAAKAIYEYNSNAKIIIILRDPAERAFSHYLMDRKLAFTDKSFEDALEEDNQFTPRTWGATSLYLDLGEYYEQVKRYYDVFPKENIMVLLNEELQQNPLETISQLYRFIGVDPDFKPDLTDEYNKAVVPRNAVMHRLLKFNVLRVFIRRNLNDGNIKNTIHRLLFDLPKQNKPSTETIQKLKKHFRNDIQKLSALLKKDLTHWL